MTWLTGIGAIFKGFFASLWDAMRRRRQDQELVDSHRLQSENEGLTYAVEASKKARKVDDAIAADERRFDDLIDGV